MYRIIARTLGWDDVKIFISCCQNNIRMKSDSVVYLNTRKKSEFEQQKAMVENYCKYKYSVLEMFHDYRVSSRPPEKRPSYQELEEFIRENDVENIIFFNPFEFSRNLDQGLKELKKLTDAGYAVYFADSDFIACHGDCDQRRQSMSSFLYFMDVYRGTMKNAASVKNGTPRANARPGRPRALDEGQREALITVRRSGTSISQICRMFNVSRSTVSKILADYPELKGEWKGNKGMDEEEPEVPEKSERLEPLLLLH
jgi:DNA invertase Pin-like site-specific DNA recombinase